MTARLVDTAVSDHFRDGIAEERRQLAEVTDRAAVLDRMRAWERELEFHTRRDERLRGRMAAGNEWLTQHPDGSAL